MAAGGIGTLNFVRYRQARACRGHPRLSSLRRGKQGVDGRDKPGHDSFCCDFVGSLQITKNLPRNLSPLTFPHLYSSRLVRLKGVLMRRVLGAGQDAVPPRGARNPAPGWLWAQRPKAGKCRNGASEGEQTDRKVCERLRTAFRPADRKAGLRALRKRPAPPGAPFPHVEGRKKDGRTRRLRKNEGSGALANSIIHPRKSSDAGFLQ
jgi:hypothetical protein